MYWKGSRCIIMSSNKNYIRDLVDNYCVIDLETTGLSCKYDEVVEIGLLKVRDNKIVDTYSQLATFKSSN